MTGPGRDAVPARPLPHGRPAVVLDAGTAVAVVLLLAVVGIGAYVAIVVLGVAGALLGAAANGQQAKARVRRQAARAQMAGAGPPARVARRRPAGEVASLIVDPAEGRRRRHAATSAMDLSRLGLFREPAVEALGLLEEGRVGEALTLVDELLEHPAGDPEVQIELAVLALAAIGAKNPRA